MKYQIKIKQLQATMWMNLINIMLSGKCQNKKNMILIIENAKTGTSNTRIWDSSWPWRKG